MTNRKDSIIQESLAKRIAQAFERALLFRDAGVSIAILSLFFMSTVFTLPGLQLIGSPAEHGNSREKREMAHGVAWINKDPKIQDDNGGLFISYATSFNPHNPLPEPTELTLAWARNWSFRFAVCIVLAALVFALSVKMRDKRRVNQICSIFAFLIMSITIFMMYSLMLPHMTYISFD